MEPVQRDYGNFSLDDYIKNNPEALKDIKVKTPKPRIRPPSQQWRLGRNGPRPLKRLGRYGPLRPGPPPYRGQNVHRADDGLPRLVLKRYNHLSPLSVFHRLGWNPLHAMARQKLQQARHFMWNRRFNNQPRHRPWMFPWGRRRYFSAPRWFNRQRPMWRPQNFHGGFRHQNRNNHLQPFTLPNQQFNAQELIKMQRMMIQAKRQKNNNMGMPVQNQMAQNSQQPRLINQLSTDPSALSSEAAMKAYPIPRDEYIRPSLNRNVRPPSPVGSIISTLSQSNTNANPFARAASQQLSLNPFARMANQSSAQNPFASTSKGAVSNFTNVSLNSGFRPTPNTTNIPCSQRFENSRLEMYENMYMTG